MSRRWGASRRPSEPDRWLDERGLYRKHMPRDASCLFRALSENVYNTQRYFHEVRNDCVRFMATNRNLFEGSMSCPFETYLKEMSNPSEWGGFNEIDAMSHVYRRDFVILEANKGSQTKICNGYGRDIYLFYIPDNKHFDAVYTKEYIANSAFCQSITYEVLYDGVFHLKDLCYAVDKMLHDKVPTDHIEYFMSENVERRRKQRELLKTMELDDTLKPNKDNRFPKCKHQTGDIEIDDPKKDTIFVLNKSLGQFEDVCLTCLKANSARELLRHGITPFPYKVAKALDPNIYRNIEFDVWSEMRREMRNGARYADGSTLQVGVKCLCRLRPEQTVPYYCHIQEMQPEAGTSVVFVEELGEKTQLRLEQLEPLPKEEMRPWAPPYRQSRPHSQYFSLSLMLQQIGNISRKHSLNKMRNKTKTACEEDKHSDKQSASGKRPLKTNITWKEDEFNAEYCTGPNEIECCQMNLTACSQCTFPQSVDLSCYYQQDYYNFMPCPLEVTALPLMVDCRPAAGAPPPVLECSAPPPPPPAASPPAADNTNQPPTGQHQQAGGGDVMSAVQPAAPARASTPAAAAGAGALHVYTAGAVHPNTLPAHSAGGGYGCPLPPYTVYGGGGGVKGGVVWCSPPAPAPPAPPLPPNINTGVQRSVQLNGSDLPMNDIPTLRFFFNLGVECMWTGTYPPQLMPPPPPHAPPRYYSPVNEITQEMQQNLSLHERPPMTAHNGGHNGGHNGDHKGKGGGGAGPGQDKSAGNQGKGNGQRPLLGPRFKRGNGDGNHGGNREGNHGGNPNNKTYHNNNNNRSGMHNNNRRSSYMEGRGAGGGGGGGMAPGYAAVASAEAECGPGVEQAMYTVPYMHYPPPALYHYYPVESEPGMMGMMGMGGYMGYVGEEAGEQYAAPLLPPYYPQPYQPQHPQHLASQPHLVSQPHQPHDHK